MKELQMSESFFRLGEAGLELRVVKLQGLGFTGLWALGVSLGLWAFGFSFGAAV